MPRDFFVTVEEDNEVIYITFLEPGTDKVLSIMWFFIDNDDMRCFYDHSDKGQELIMIKIRGIIIEEINRFLSPDVETEETEAFPITNKSFFDEDDFLERWTNYYYAILDSDEVRAEYLFPKELS